MQPFLQRYDFSFSLLGIWVGWLLKPGEDSFYFEWPTQCAGLLLSLKHIFLNTYKIDFLCHHESLDSPTQFHSSAFEIHNNTIVNSPLLVFSLFYRCLLVFFHNFIFFSGGSFCPNFSRTNHFRYHVINICLFILDWVY